MKTNQLTSFEGIELGEPEGSDEGSELGVREGTFDGCSKERG